MLPSNPAMRVKPTKRKRRARQTGPDSPKTSSLHTRCLSIGPARRILRNEQRHRTQGVNVTCTGGG